MHRTIPSRPPLAHLAVALCSIAATSHAAGPKETGDPAIGDVVRPIVEQAMATGGTAGLQVGVVFEDGRHWSGGFGVADTDTGRAVNTDSRFYIASTTKALTALAAARLHHRGQFDLDRTLPEALPPGCTPSGAEDVTIRDLLTHTHGLRNRGLSWRVAFTGEYTADYFLERMPDCEFSGRGTFRYTNFGYDIVGVLLAPERTRGWKEVLQREVFGPLGMTSTTAYVSRIPEDDLAMPHELDARGVHRIPLRKADDNMGPAGGHFSTASDLCRLLQAELTGGLVNGERVIEADVIDDTQHRHATQDREFIHYRRWGFGLGWDLGDYASETVIHRPGGFAGYYSNAAFLPEHGFGVVVLANGGRYSSVLAEHVACAIYDHYLERPDALERFAGRLDEFRQELDDAQRAQSEPERPSVLDAPTASWDAYVGRYEHPTWGTIVVYRDPQGLSASMGPIAGRIDPVAGGPHAFHTSMFGYDRLFRFELDHLGQADRCVLAEDEVYRRVE